MFIKSISATTKLFLLLGAVSVGLIASNNSEDKMLSDIDSKNTKAQQTHPEDRLYMQLDKPFYKPGETIWFNTWVRDGLSLKPSSKSDIVHLDLYDPKGNKIQSRKIVATEGLALGDFEINESLPGGMYEIKAHTDWMLNEGPDNVYSKKFQVQKVVLPNLKMNINFLRKAYGPGDSFEAKLTLETLTNQPLANTEVAYKISLAGKEVETLKAQTNEKGQVILRGKLPRNLQTSDALLNAMIQFEGNTESISRSIPVSLANIDLQFYPEGGDLIREQPGRVAFKATNEFGKAADIEGKVIDQNGHTVTSFSSYHNGIGRFDLMCEYNKSYSVKITKPKGIDKTYPLPAVKSMGYSLLVNQQDNQLTCTVSSSVRDRMHLIGQIRGKVFYKKSFDVKAGQTDITFDSETLPIGVCQLTLFDNNGVPRAERLVFANPNKQLNIEITTGKSQYLPRERVDVSFLVKDQNGNPAPGLLGVSVVDDNLLAYADDKSSNILTSLLLEADITGEVEEPSFYFNPEEPKRKKALDLLLMTQGWRRFTWKEIINDELPTITHSGEKAIITGQIILNDKSVPGEVEFRIDGQKYTTDEQGKFTIKGITLDHQAYLEVEKKGYFPIKTGVLGYTNNQQYYLYPVQNNNTYSWSSGANKRYKNEGMLKKNPGRAVKMRAIPNPAMAVEIEEEMEWAADPMQAMDDADFKEDVPNIAIPLEIKKDQVVNPEDFKKIEDDAAVNLVLNKEVGGANKLLVGLNEEKVLADEIVLWEIGNAGVAINDLEFAAPQNFYYRARQFPRTTHDPNAIITERSDFRTTAYWNGNVNIDENGKGNVSFYNTDAITSFKITAEGISRKGLVGRANQKIFTQLPLSMAVKTPPTLSSEDRFVLPLTFKNNTPQEIIGDYVLILPAVFSSNETSTNFRVEIPAHSTKTTYHEYIIGNQPGKYSIQVKFDGNGFKDAFSKEIEIESQGYPAEVSFSAQELDKTYTLQLTDVIDGSLQANLTAYPSVVNDLMNGVASILREPYGCFEQTSTSNYPNIMVMDYMQSSDYDDPEAYEKASDLLDKGYKRLTSFETKEKGYEWFGSAPGHEALTAYGLMEFIDMKKVYPDVDQAMIDRTAEWLLNRRDNQGGFKRNGRALDSFGRASADVTDAYVVYALSEAGYKNLDKELNKVYRKAKSSNDPYQLALVANALFNYQDKRYNEFLDMLVSQQANNGAWLGSKESITMSGGKSLDIETSGLAIIALLKSKNASHGSIQKGVQFLVSSRTGHGGFGSTQATVLALKALTEFAKASKTTKEAGTIECYINGQLACTEHFESGQTGEILFEGLENHLSIGKNKIRISYKGCHEALPYAIGVNYRTSKPQNDPSCQLAIKTTTNKKECRVGEIVRLTTVIENTANKGLPMTMGVVGIPAGLSAQAWQLKELQEKKKIDFYEVYNNRVVLYYRDMAPNERHEIALDLKAEVPGNYQGSASSTYLYYTAEAKNWTTTPEIIINN